MGVLLALFGIICMLTVAYAAVSSVVRIMLGTEKKKSGGKNEKKSIRKEQKLCKRFRVLCQWKEKKKLRKVESKNEKKRKKFKRNYVKHGEKERERRKKVC